MSKSSAGKGDRCRIGDRKRFNDNYDRIDWGRNKRAKACTNNQDQYTIKDIQNEKVK